jgi:hypothetical protein
VGQIPVSEIGRPQSHPQHIQYRAAGVTPADRFKSIESIYPPWRLIDGRDVTDRGFEFTVPPPNALADFRGSLDNPRLVLFAPGNYFFALGQLVTAFGENFYETLPPGLMLKQMDASGTVTSGNMTWTVKPDIYLAELVASTQLIQSWLHRSSLSRAMISPSWYGPAIQPVWRLADRPRRFGACPNAEFEGVAR